MEKENNMYFSIAGGIKIDLRKQFQSGAKPYYIVSKRKGLTRNETQRFALYEWAKAYFIELIADYL